VAAYQYDEAFPPGLMEATLQLYKNAPLTFRFVVSARSGRNPAYCQEIFDEAGLYPLQAPIPCKKTGSGEGSSFTIYGRRCCDYSDVGDLVLPPHATTAIPPTPDLSIPPTPLPDDVAQILAGNREAFQRYYQALATKTESLMSQKRHQDQKEPRLCTTSQEYAHCGNRTCMECNTAFEHIDIRALYAQPVSWLPGQSGLFSGKDLLQGQYVIEYTGRRSTRSVAGAYVFEVAKGHFLDAKGRGLQQYINHGCDPNCVFQKWNDSRGKARISVYTRRAIRRGDELTVNYGSSREAFDCQCSACRLDRNTGPSPGKLRVDSK